DRDHEQPHARLGAGDRRPPRGARRGPREGARDPRGAVRRAGAAGAVPRLVPGAAQGARRHAADRHGAGDPRDGRDAPEPPDRVRAAPGGPALAAPGRARVRDAADAGGPARRREPPTERLTYPWSRWRSCRSRASTTCGKPWGATRTWPTG